MKRRVKELLEKIQTQKPVIQCITNMVTVNDCANILLALGASPTMAQHKQEVEEIATHVAGLVCNMGGIAQFTSMKRATYVAKKRGIPVVVDPVGVAASTYRRKKCLYLIRKKRVTCIRGNYAEIMALIENASTAKGVDTEGKYGSNFQEKMKAFAGKHQVIVVATGKVDYITDGTKIIENTTGDELLMRITGAGCMESCVLAASLAVDATLETVVTACNYYGQMAQLAGAYVREEKAGTMTFRQKFLDLISEKTLDF